MSMREMLPEALRGVLHDARRRARRAARAGLDRSVIDDAPWNRVGFADRARPSPLVTDIFDRIKHMPGWFNIDDCAHFSLLLRYQTAMGVSGDLLEIGCYHGRAAALMATTLVEGEQLILCDTFAATEEDSYSPATPASVVANILAVAPNVQPHLDVRVGMSSSLDLGTARLRFAHVDGGHSHATALGDLRLCARHLVPGGVIAVDDYRHPDYPGVSTAVDEFLESESGRGLRVVADLNRFGALGRKLYLVRERGVIVGAGAGDGG